VHVTTVRDRSIDIDGPDGGITAREGQAARDGEEATVVQEPPVSITDADVRSLAAKLKGLHTLLTPGEQALLRIVLDRAADHAVDPVEDTGGFAWGVSFNPFTYLDAIAIDASSEHHQRP
jgi:hypothetical protein